MAEVCAWKRSQRRDQNLFEQKPFLESGNQKESRHIQAQSRLSDTALTCAFIKQI
jgi:hypothetical protein